MPSLPTRPQVAATLPFNAAAAVVYCLIVYGLVGLSRVRGGVAL